MFFLFSACQAFTSLSISSGSWLDFVKHRRPFLIATSYLNLESITSRLKGSPSSSYSKALLGVSSVLFFSPPYSVLRKPTRTSNSFASSTGLLLLNSPSYDILISNTEFCLAHSSHHLQNSLHTPSPKSYPQACPALLFPFLKIPANSPSQRVTFAYPSS